jgi:hypothetical protein
MKRILFAILALSILAGTIAFAAEGDGPAQGIWTVRERYNYTNITASDNTIIKASPGMLAGMVVHGGTMGAITVYDNTACSSGTIATIASPVAGQVIPFGVNTVRGLCIRTAAAMNITVVWK